jgi:hypothetical protein
MGRRPRIDELFALKPVSISTLSFFPDPDIRYRDPWPRSSREGLILVTSLIVGDISTIHTVLGLLLLVNDCIPSWGERKFKPYATSPFDPLLKGHCKPYTDRSDHKSVRKLLSAGFVQRPCHFYPGKS